ncbi:MAG: hypothetical protein IJJ43_06730 [Oscillospiraceae bacterium]|nr:hypothetical protein [Oscillospiraceae bacterium]
MSEQDELFRQERAREQEKARRERQKKRDERSKRFWSTFLFTENGKPKSGFLVYTFCLSIVFIALYILAFRFVIDLLAPLTASWPTFWGNLLGSLSVSVAVLAVAALLHRVFSDKRLMFGTYLWLCVYVLAAIIYMAFFLRDAGTMREFMLFALWFAILPVVLGTVLFFFFCKRDHHPKAPVAEEPEWKKYVHRR